jgi:arginyl-tRNA synthetase
MNIFDFVKEQVCNSFLEKYQDAKALLATKNEALSFEIPNQKENGDIATNIAMICAKDLKTSPIIIAKEIASNLAKNNNFSKVEVAGPGFINLTLQKHVFHEFLTSVKKADTNFGSNDIGNGINVNLEFLSTNPTGPLHIGHLRNAVFGEALANLLKFSGYQVTKEYYINDAGGQIDVVANSVLIRYQEIALNTKLDIPEGLYPGEYLIEVAQYLFKENPHLLNAETIDMEWVKEKSVSFIMEMIKDTLALLGVKFDVFFSEKSLHRNGDITKTMELLDKKSLVYRGILEAPKGQVPEDYESREQLLFKSTQYGDDVDRPVQKSDGSWTYIAADIAYMKNKLDRGFQKLIFILGADHGGYTGRLSAANIALSEGKATLDVKLMQLVRFVKNGEIVKMSKRSGNFLLASDVIKDVGKDAIFLNLLSRKNDQSMDFDFDKVKEQNKDNPIFYIQYASARVSSVLRALEEEYPEIFRNWNNGQGHNLEGDYPEEIYEIIKLLASFPKIMKSAALASEPHRIVFYLIDLASAFHQLWNLGREKEELKFIQTENPILSKNYIILLQAIKTTLKNGLRLFNIEALDSM